MICDLVLPVSHSRAAVAQVSQDAQHLLCNAGHLLLVASPALLHHLSKGLALRKLLRSDLGMSGILRCWKMG